MTNKALKKLFREQAGSMAVPMAVCVLAIIVCVGAALDFQQVSNIRQRAQTATDAAALAAAPLLAGDRKRAEILATEVFDANFDLGPKLIDRDISLEFFTDDLSYKVNFTGAYRTNFMGLVGVQSVDVSASSTASLGGIDIAITVDRSGSLLNLGVERDVVDAVRDLVREVSKSPTASQTNISIIPFGTTVNIGADKGSWLTDKRTLDFAPDNWHGCVFARLKDDLDITDAPPSAGEWEPYIWRRDYDPMRNVWGDAPLTQFSDGVFNFQQMSNGDATFGPPLYSRGTLGPNAGCTGEIRELTNDHKGTLVYLSPGKNEINVVALEGGTSLSMALTWAWRTISPRWRGVWPSAGPNLPNTANGKFIIMLSDGAPRWNLPELSGYGEANDPSSLGFAFQDPDQLFERFMAACDAAKADGVQIFTILALSPDTRAAEAMRDCAQSPDQAFLLDDIDELANVYLEILDRIQRLRVTT